MFAARKLGVMGDMLLELELTGRCQLRCRHCYADSGPSGTDGAMTANDWQRVIADAADLGVGMVQFIGGEPSLHSAFRQLVAQAINAGLRVEVFSNLVHVTKACWDLYSHPRVSLATSYYSDTAAEHQAVTGRRGSHARTRANIAEAVRRKIPIRAGIIDVVAGQRVEQARAELQAMGVPRIGIDRLRGVGRGAGGGGRPSMVELCGRCGHRCAAITPNGDVLPCALARWMQVGSVRQQPLGEILDGPAWRACVATIPGPHAAACFPDQCSPDVGGCNPSNEGPDCYPAERPACNPAYPEPKPR